MFAASLHSTSSSVASLSPADVNHDLISTQKKRGAGKAWIISNTFPSRLLAEEVFAGDNWSHKRNNETMKGTVSDYQCTKHNCPYIHRIRSVLQGDITNPTRVYLLLLEFGAGFHNLVKNSRIRWSIKWEPYK